MAAPIRRREQSTSKLIQRRRSSFTQRQKPVQLWVRSRPKNRPWLKALNWLLAVLLLWGAANFLALSLRWGAQLMLDPEALPWLQSSFWNSADRSQVSKPITLDEITSEVTAQGHQLGEPLKLKAGQGVAAAEYWLLPIQETGNTTKIVELRFYRLLSDHPQVTLQAKTTLPVSPLAPDVVIDSLKGGSDKIAPPRYPLPLTEVTWLRAANQGVWLTLQGQWSRGSTPLRYGQLLYVSFQKPDVEPLIAWSSPSNRLPKWTDLDGVGPIDLVIDTTLGLEPGLQGYQVQTKRGGASPIKLSPITLTAVPADIDDPKGVYYKALVLARSKLWAAASQQLQARKETLKKAWTPTAEAQLRLVTRHAELTRTQADRQWSSPSQQILAQLIDGRWTAALKQLKATPEAQETLMQTLEHDQGGRLWNRVIAALQIKPNDPTVLLWGGLILKAQQGSQAALIWLTEQKAPPAVKQQFQTLARPKSLKANPPKTKTVAPGTARGNPVENRAGPAIAALLGTVHPLNTPNLAQWQLPSGAAASPAAEDTWYEIDVDAWQQLGEWRSGASTDWGSGLGLWQQVEPALQSSLTLLIWITPTQARPLSLRPRGVQVQNGQLKVLATGLAVPDPAQRPALAFSQGSLVWLDPNQSQPASTQPSLSAALQSAIAPYVVLKDNQIMPLLSHIQMYTLDITGDGRDDSLLSIDSDGLDQLANLGVACDRTAPKTLLVNAAKQVLYTDLFQPQTVIALTPPGSTSPPALLTEQNGQYQLKIWSKASQQFE